jgi:hypothetical protein
MFLLRMRCKRVRVTLPAENRFEIPRLKWSPVSTRYARLLLLTLLTLMRMGPLRPLYILFALLALATPFTIASAHLTSDLDPPTLIPDNQRAPDNVLLLPLNGRLAKNRIDGLLVPSKLWSRQQEVTCATNYTACQGSQFCCPNGSACCPGGFLGQFIRGEGVGDDSCDSFH